MENKDDGIFFIDLDNFVKYIRDVQVCFFHDNFNYSAIQLEVEEDGEMFIHLQGKTPQIVYLSLN